MSSARRRAPVIVGIGTSDLPRAPHLDTAGHHVLAMQRALEDAGVAKAEVDGYCCAGGSKSSAGPDDMGVMVEYLGLSPRFTDGTMTGGSSFELHVEHAAAAIETGLCDTVLITYGSDQLSRLGRQLGTKGHFRERSKVEGPAQFEAPYGGTIVSSYALAAARHMHEFGTTPEQLASIAVAARAHAFTNPEAMYRDPITVEDVLASPMVSDPLHKLDSCVISDGGGALVLTTTERAQDLAGREVAILSAASAQTHWNISMMRDFTTTAATTVGRDVFGRAGLGPGDVDVFECYDSFTITVLLLLEDLGFCPKGQGGAFAASGTIGPGGSLPVNTDGGGLSALHPGMRGIFLLIEAVRQLRGEARNQVEECEVALACGVGAWLSCIGAVLLGEGSVMEVTGTWDDPAYAGRPVPDPDALSAEYWAAAGRGELRYQECPACHHRQFYPRQVCTECGATPEWRTASGRGRVHTFSVVRKNLAPPFDRLTPYVVAVIELEEGPRMMGNVTHCDPDQVRIDMAVTAHAVVVEEGVAVPFWRPDVDRS